MHSDIARTTSLLEAQLREQIERRAAGLPESQRREVVLDVLSEMTPPGWRYQLRRRHGEGVEFSLLPSFLDR